MSDNASPQDQVQPTPATEHAEQETLVSGNSAESQAEQKPAVPSPGLTESFGRYEILKELGKGAMGSVYLAYDTQLDNRVALKIPRFTEQDGPQYIQRFYREARSAFKLRHPNICPVYDVAEIDGQHYISMAYIEGHPLSDVTDKKQSLPERQVARIIRKLALALADAHDAGVVHRDLKPANIMIDGKNKEPIVMDFGLARQVDATAETQLTQAGTLLGSPAYMSPEQVAAELGEVGPSTDIYSLGVVMYQLLTGTLPFQGSLATVLGRIAVEEPEPPSNRRPNVDTSLEAICLKAMAKNIGDRYASMQELARALTVYLKSDRTGKSKSKQPTVAAPTETSWEDEFELPASLPPRLSGIGKRRSPQKSGRRKKKPAGPAANPVWLVAGGAVGTAVVLGAIALMLKGGGADDAQSRQTSDTSAMVASIETAKNETTTDSPQPKPVAPNTSTPDSAVNQPPLRPNKPTGQPPEKQPPLPFERDFAKADRNGDGQLDATELPLHIVRRADQNQDELLTRNEFDQAVKQQGEALFRPPDRGQKPLKRPRLGEGRPRPLKGPRPKKFD